MILNKQIYPNEPLIKREVERRAKEMWKDYPLDNNTMYIYVEQPKVSDLFIGTEHEIRRCNGKEWLDYFNEFIK